MARGGIEPPTRGFSVRRRARFGLTNPKAGKGYLLGRPNLPTRPNLSRTGAPKSWPKTRVPDPVQRVRCVATELFPNRRRTGPAGLHLLFLTVRPHRQDAQREVALGRSLFGQPETQPEPTYFGQNLDSDGTVLLCLHQWGGAHEHPSLMSPDPATRGNGLLLFFRVDNFDRLETLIGGITKMKTVHDV